MCRGTGDGHHMLPNNNTRHEQEQSACSAEDQIHRKANRPRRLSRKYHEPASCSQTEKGQQDGPCRQPHVADGLAMSFVARDLQFDFRLCVFHDSQEL
jgi:hypothetical protein